MMDVQLLSSIPDWDWPPDAADVLLAALRGGAVDGELELALELASSVVVMNDEIARAILDVLLDQGVSVSVRESAAIALGPTLEEMDTYDPEDPIDALEEPLVSGPVHGAIRTALRDTYLNAGAPKDVRRRALEASVRALEDWHAGAIRASYYSGDDDWKLTAVFCMQYAPDFDREILEALETSHPLIRIQAVRAAGEYEVKEAWPHVRAILEARTGDKELLLAAIAAAGSIKPDEAEELFARLDDSDVEIAEAIREALMLGGSLDMSFDDFEDWQDGPARP
jgi:hypothetical protein